MFTSKPPAAAAAIIIIAAIVSSHSHAPIPLKAYSAKIS